jgi:F0F1-type ATP synthase assembly protein I
MTTSEGTALSPAFASREPRGRGSTQPRRGSTDHGVDLMLAVAIQFVVAVAVWGTVGLVLDLLLPTAPWLQFAGVTAGSLIGLVLVQRRATAPVAAPPESAGEGDHA